jgi:hypothetical protein
VVRFVSIIENEAPTPMSNKNMHKKEKNASYNNKL